MLENDAIKYSSIQNEPYHLIIFLVFVDDLHFDNFIQFYSILLYYFVVVLTSKSAWEKINFTPKHFFFLIKTWIRSFNSCFYFKNKLNFISNKQTNKWNIFMKLKKKQTNKWKKLCAITKWSSIVKILKRTSTIRFYSYENL